MSDTPEEWDAGRIVETSLQHGVADQLVVLFDVVAALNAITARTNADINANPAAVIKDVAREVKTVARQVTRITRMVAADFDSDYIGPE